MASLPCPLVCHQPLCMMRSTFQAVWVGTAGSWALLNTLEKAAFQRAKSASHLTGTDLPLLWLFKAILHPKRLLIMTCNFFMYHIIMLESGNCGCIWDLKLFSDLSIARCAPLHHLFKRRMRRSSRRCLTHRATPCCPAVQLRPRSASVSVVFSQFYSVSHTYLLFFFLSFVVHWCRGCTWLSVSRRRLVPRKPFTSQI